MADFVWEGEGCIFSFSVYFYSAAAETSPSALNLHFNSKPWQEIQQAGLFCLSKYMHSKLLS